VTIFQILMLLISIVIPCSSAAVGCAVATFDFRTTRVEMNLIKRKITSTIDRNQIAAVHKDHWFQNLPALEIAENIFK